MVLGVILIGSLFVKRRMRYRRTGKENQILVKKNCSSKGRTDINIALGKANKVGVYCIKTSVIMV